MSNKNIPAWRWKSSNICKTLILVILYDSKSYWAEANLQANKEHVTY